MVTFPPSSNIGEEEWDRHKNLIISLYLGTDHEDREGSDVDEGQIKGKTLSEVAESMRGYGFNASVSQFEARLNTWGARKNLKPEEWEQIHERLDILPQATKSRVLISGRVVADSKIKRARRYRKQKSRAANTASTDGPSRFSALSHHVHIEVQESDGRWIQLLNADTTPTLGIPHSPRAAVIQEAYASELSVLSPISGTLTSLRPTVRNNNVSIQAYQLVCPTTWLGSLPSRRIISTMRGYYGLYGVNPNTGNTSQIRATPTGVIEWDINEIPYSRTSDESLQSLNAIVAGQDSRHQNERNQRMVTPSDVCRSKFSQFLLSAIMNGICEPNEIPEAVLDGLFEPNGAVNSLLLHCFKDAPYLSTTLVSTFLNALIVRGKRGTIARLLKKGLVHVNNTVLFSREGRLTPLELAALKGNEALVELLLSYRGDPNKSYFRGRSYGALECLMPHFIPEDNDLKSPPSLDILHKLFEAGAIVRPDTYFPFDKLDEANLVSRIVSDCIERHGGRCMSSHQQTVDRALEIAARKGRTETFLAISPHATHTSSSLNERLLSAAIQGRQSAIINSVMLRRPNINPLSHTLYYRPHSDCMFSSAVRAPQTSPLAQSILTKNTELIEYFSNAGVFESLHKGGRFEVALGAAAEIGDVNLVTRLLTSCPDLELRDMTIALGSAIEEGHEELALLLLEEGASAYRCGRSKFNEQEWLPASTGDLTLLAVRKGNKKVAQKLLSIGDRTEMPASYSKLATVELLTTCLTTAVSQDNSTLAHKLIERGANALDENVLTYAMRRGTTGMFQLLLHNKNGLRPVVTKGLRTEVLKTAIEQGPNKLGITPLGVAIRAAEAEFSQEFGYNVARLLLEHRCDPNNTVRFCECYSLPTNHTAMLEAIDVRNQELVKLLIEYGADVNLELRHLVRRTPLQKAAEKGDLAMVRLLLQHGADVNAKLAIAMGGTALLIID
ncbi:hypothetical protein CHU98_g6367 [Xylaria longipes]|nr:hypothetical protein CHU98_g6367 [Xylaria longipes]